MKEIRLVIQKNGNGAQIEKVIQMIDELNAIGVLDNTRSCIIYDENDIELSSKVENILDRYNYIYR